MSNLRIIVENRADDAILTAAPAVVEALPVTNLQIAPRARVMRSTSIADQQILGTHSGGQFADGFSLARHNLTSVATVRIRLFAGAGQSGELVYDSGDLAVSDPVPAGVFRAGVDAWGDPASDADVIFAHWFAPVAFQSFEITLKDADNPAGYLQAGRLFMGLSLSPSVNFDWGARLEWIDNIKQERTAAGTLRSDGIGAERRFSIDLSHLSVADRQAFATAFRRVSRRQDILVAGYPEAGGAQSVDHTLVAKLVSGNVYTAAGPNRFSAPFVFEEA